MTSFEIHIGCMHQLNGHACSLMRWKGLQSTTEWQSHRLQKPSPKQTTSKNELPPFAVVPVIAPACKFSWIHSFEAPKTICNFQEKRSRIVLPYMCALCACSAVLRPAGTPTAAGGVCTRPCSQRQPPLAVCSSPTHPSTSNPVQPSPTCQGGRR